MKKVLALLILLLVMPVLCYAMGGPAPQKVKKAAYPYLIDNFEDGNFNKDPEWYTFGKVVPSAAKNADLKGGEADVLANVGTYSLNLKGTASNWYVGGMGMILGIDATGYDSVDLDVYGNGENSGTLKIELYEDRKGSSDVDVDKNWVPVYDNLWSYELPVKWNGWKHVSVPISQFKVTGGGDKIWNPTTKGGKYGLIKVQLICVAASQTGAIDFNVDNLELGVKK